MQRKHSAIKTLDDIIAGFQCPGYRFRGTREAIENQFNSRVTKVEGFACWIWHGNRNNLGYGLISLAYRGHYAHRIAYLLHQGSIDPDLKVRHSCDNPSCVNPSHLSQGTQLENIHDAISRNRHVRGETCGRSKLTETEVIEIRRTFKHGDSVWMGQKYGLYPSTILAIVHRYTWKHLP